MKITIQTKPILEKLKKKQLIKIVERAISNSEENVSYENDIQWNDNIVALSIEMTDLIKRFEKELILQNKVFSKLIIVKTEEQNG